MPLRIGVDIDGVCLDTVGSLLKYFNNNNGTDYTHNDVKYYELEKVFGLSNEDVIDLVMGFYTSDEFEDVKPLHGAQQGIAALRKLGEVLMITSRPMDMTRDITRAHMNKFFRGNYHDVYFSDDFTRQSKGDDKAHICTALGIGIMAEDSFDYARTCAQAGVQTVLLSHPWNSEDRYGPLVENVYRVNDWRGIEEKVRELCSGMGVSILSLEPRRIGQTSASPCNSASLPAQAARQNASRP